VTEASGKPDRPGQPAPVRRSSIKILRKDDLYETPAVAVEALLKVETFPHHIWEPACGPGAIARVLRQHGHTVWASDLVNYNSKDQDAHGVDFLMETQMRFDIEAIITNPPFKLGGQFVERALLFAPKVAMLLRLSFLEAETRTAILDGGMLARVHVFSNRLPMMHRAGWTGKKVGSWMTFAWFVWERAHTGPAQLDRIAWTKD
jgi:hypothetical protein